MSATEVPADGLLQRSRIRLRGTAIITAARVDCVQHAFGDRLATAAASHRSSGNPHNLHPLILLTEDHLDRVSDAPPMYVSASCGILQELAPRPGGSGTVAGGAPNPTGTWTSRLLSGSTRQTNSPGKIPCAGLTRWMILSVGVEQRPRRVSNGPPPAQTPGISTGKLELRPE